MTTVENWGADHDEGEGSRAFDGNYWLSPDPIPARGAEEGSGNANLGQKGGKRPGLQGEPRVQEEPDPLKKKGKGHPRFRGRGGEEKGKVVAWGILLPGTPSQRRRKEDISREGGLSISLSDLSY